MTQQLIEADFRPDAWLRQYINLGGGYSVVGDAVWLHWSLRGDVDEQELKAHETSVRHDEQKRDAVKALIMLTASREIVE